MIHTKKKKKKKILKKNIKSTEINGAHGKYQ